VSVGSFRAAMEARDIDTIMDAFALGLGSSDIRESLD